MSPVDAGMAALGVNYTRYVDDVIMYGEKTAVEHAFRSFKARVRRRGLAVHAVAAGGKTHLTPMLERFSYLGYVFHLPVITVRDSTIERLLASIAAKFSDLKYNSARKIERIAWLDERRMREIFLAELNERISGAIRENRRYGWIAYFSQITDLRLLSHLDVAVRRMFERSASFGHQAPAGLKSFVRAYFAMRYSPFGGYVRNFDKFLTSIDRLRFLATRGRVDPNAALTEEQINDIFDRYVARLLGEMQQDEAILY